MSASGAPADAAFHAVASPLLVINWVLDPQGSAWMPLSVLHQELFCRFLISVHVARVSFPEAPCRRHVQVFDSASAQSRRAAGKWEAAVQELRPHAAFGRIAWSAEQRLVRLPWATGRSVLVEMRSNVRSPRTSAAALFQQFPSDTRLPDRDLATRRKSSPEVRGQPSSRLKSPQPDLSAAVCMACADTACTRSKLAIRAPPQPPSQAPGATATSMPTLCDRCGRWRELRALLGSPSPSMTFPSYSDAPPAAASCPASSGGPICALD